MFNELPDQWLPGAFSSKLPKRKPLNVVVAGVELALFRDADGAPRAVVDRCPHRGVKLSNGEVAPDGCLVCPFHGWAFRGDGACARVPLNPTARRDRLSAQAVPVAEAGGLIWIYTRIGATDIDVPPVPPIARTLIDPRARRRELESDWACHWTRAMENMLDIPHLPYVHRRTIGRGLIPKNHQRTPALHLDLTDTDAGFLLRWRFGEVEDRTYLEWRRPTGMVLTIVTPVGNMNQHMFCVPGAEGRTRMMLVTTSNRPWWARLLPDQILEGFEDRILLEDQQIVESSPPGAVPDAGHERSVATDKPTLRFRAWYRKHRQAA